MKIKVIDKEYEIDKKVDTILEALFFIKENKDNINFRSHCESGVCGCCSVKVDGVEKLACVTKVKDGNHIEVLSNHLTISDLIVKSNKNSYKNIDVTNKQNLENEQNCIMCESCYSSCPVFSVNKNFIGPFGLVKFYIYENEKNINSIQKDGVWDCTLCGNCNMVCPAGIDIKGDILKLQGKSMQLGYQNPIFNNFGGFNP